jgi:uncharacterized Zn-finger protein
MSIKNHDLEMALFECKICNFCSNSKHNYNRHINSARHKKSEETGIKSLSKFYCDKCDIKCSDKIKWALHVSTAKHIKKEENEKKRRKKE